MSKNLTLVLMQRGLSQATVDPATLDELLPKVLDDLIADRVLVAKAKADSIVVTEREVKEALDRQIEEIKAQAGDAGFRAELERQGLSERGLRKRLRPSARRFLLTERAAASIAREVVVTYQELVDFYKTHRDSLPVLPANYKLAHIMIKPRPDAARLAQARLRAQALLDSLRAGADFAALARATSDDSTSAQHGGALGTFTRQGVIPEFADAAFSLPPGEVSEPVLTPLGYHLILVEERREAQVRARHILVSVETTAADRERTVRELYELRQRTMAGESFGELARAYSEDESTGPDGGSMRWLMEEEITKKIPSFWPQVQQLKVGEVSLPFQSRTGAFHLVELVGFKPERRPTLEADSDVIERELRGRKMEAAYERTIAEEKSRLYVETRL